MFVVSKIEFCIKGLNVFDLIKKLVILLLLLVSVIFFMLNIGLIWLVSGVLVIVINVGVIIEFNEWFKNEIFWVFKLVVLVKLRFKCNFSKLVIDWCKLLCVINNDCKFM